MSDVGVDVGGTTTRVVAFDAGRRALAATAAPTPAGAPAIVELVARLVREVAPTGVATVGLGLPGRVVDGVVSSALNLSIDDPVDIGRLLAEALGGRVHVENDVNAAALGAFAHLGLTPSSSLAYINVGTGIAAGFVLGGRLWRGSSGGAGEIGHLPMRTDGPPCACGQTGCAEAIGAGRLVVDPAHHATALDAIAWTVQLCVMALDVDHLVLGGGVTEQGPALLGALGDRLRATEARAVGLHRFVLADRLQLAPAGVPLGSLGALLAADGAQHAR